MVKRWELVALCALGPSCLFLGETLRTEGLALAAMRREASTRASALRTFDAQDLSGRSFRVRGDVKRVFVFEDGSRARAWRSALLAAAERGVDTYVVCIGLVEECQTVDVPPPTRFIAYAEWKYLPALTAVHEQRGAVIIEAGAAVGQWVDNPPATDGERSRWERLLGPIE